MISDKVIDKKNWFKSRGLIETSAKKNLKIFQTKLETKYVYYEQIYAINIKLKEINLWTDVDITQ